MSDYAIANLKEDVEDMAPKFGLSPALESHFAKRDLEAEGIGLSYQVLQANTRGPFGHRHKQDEEVYVVVGGSGRVKLGDDVRDLHQWDAVRVAPATPRQFEAGPDGLELLAFGESTPDDQEMLPDWWSDDGTS